MVRPVTNGEVAAVQQMLAAKWRHVQIARELNLSLWTISKIAHAFRQQEEILGEGESLDDDAPPGYEAKNLRRCPECGAMVYLWPCLACRGAMAGVVLEEEEEDEEEELEDLFGIEEAMSLEF